MGARGIPADAFEIEQGFCSPSPLIKTCPLAVHKFRWRNQRFRASLILSLEMSVSGKATPSFFSLAAPSGITPTPLFQRLCAKGGCLPFGNPAGFVGNGYPHRHSVWPHSPKSAKQKRRVLSIHDIRAALFYPPSAMRSRSAFANICGSFTNAIQHNSFL